MKSKAVAGIAVGLTLAAATQIAHAGLTWTFTVSGVTDTGYSYDPTTGGRTDFSGQAYTMTFVLDPERYASQFVSPFQRIGQDASSGPATVTLALGGSTRTVVLDPSVGSHFGRTELYNVQTQFPGDWRPDQIAQNVEGCVTAACDEMFHAQGSLAIYVPTGLGLDFEQSFSRVIDPATDWGYMAFQIDKLIGGVNFQTDFIVDSDPTFVSFNGRRVATSVPEPQTLGMLLTGLCGLPLVWRRRRERSRC